MQDNCLTALSNGFIPVLDPSPYVFDAARYPVSHSRSTSCAGARHPASHGGDLAKPALRLPKRRPMDDSTNSWEWQFGLMHAHSGLGSSSWLHAWLESRKSEISFKTPPVRKLSSGENAGQPDLSLHRSLDDGALACPSAYAQQCSPARAKDLARQGSRWCLSTNYPCLLGNGYGCIRLLCPT